MNTVCMCLVVAASLCSVGAYTWDNTCTSNSFPENITQFCQNNPKGKAPYIQDCSAYFDCGFSHDFVPRYFQQHLRTCDYPQLFDPVSESCQSFSIVSCCDRIEPVSPCDYRQFKCPYAHCQPCDFNRPSCFGMSNGLHAVENRPNVYFECQQQRTMAASVQSCPQSMEFDSRASQCSPVQLS